MTKSGLTKHIVCIIGLTVLLALGMVCPFLPGDYDRLAMPLSLIIQIFGVVGLLLTVTGVFGALFPGKQFALSIINLSVSAFVILVLAVIGFASAGKVLGILIIATGMLIFIRLKRRIQRIKTNPDLRPRFQPFYLIFLPVIVLVLQLVLAKPVTDWSRNRAIENANEHIVHLEAFQTKNGHYPVTLQAQWKDYYPDVAGVEKYHYMPEGNSYNLSFEQPRFLLDNLGTREWVVYNPQDEQKAYSHTSWFLLLTEEELEGSQGWYTTGKTGHKYWKYFLFD